MAQILEFEGISKSYGENHILDNFSLQVKEGEFLVIYGKPGSGKSVLLRILLGLERADSGVIMLRGTDVTHYGPGKRAIEYVPQSFALFPNQNVFENIAYPLILQKVEKEAITQSVNRVADMLKIGHLLKKQPGQLSGGEKQRVAIARGLVKDCDMYVLDDPLVGLDYKLREQLQDDLKKLQQEMRATIIYSTSDCLEALNLADSIAVFSNRKCLETGSPEDIYYEPEHLEAIRMVGFPKVNEIRGKIIHRDRKNQFISNDEAFSFYVGETTNYEFEIPVIACIRPEDITPFPQELSEKGSQSELMELVLKENLGGEEIVNMKWRNQEIRSVMSHAVSDSIIEKTLKIYLDPFKFRIYSDMTGKFIAKGEVLHG